MYSIGIPEEDRERMHQLNKQVAIGAAAKKQLDGMLDMMFLQAGVEIKEGDQIKLTDTDVMIISLPKPLDHSDEQGL